MNPDKTIGVLLILGAAGVFIPYTILSLYLITPIYCVK